MAREFTARGARAVLALACAGGIAAASLPASAGGRADLQGRPTAPFNATRWIIKFDKDAAGLAAAAAQSTKGRVNLQAGRFAAARSPSARAEALLRATGHAGGLTLTHRRTLAVGAELFEVGGASPVDLERVRKEIAAMPGVVYVAEDRRMTPQLLPNDPLFRLQWHYGDDGIRAIQAWDTATGDGAVVAVVDTGITAHAELAGNTLPGYDFISEDFVSNDGDGRDADPSDPGDFEDSIFGFAPSSWHGTHTAGTVAAIANNGIGVAGVAFDAKVVPVRVLGTGGGFLSDIVDGVVWAAGGEVAGVPANANPAGVINMSLGGGGGCAGPEQDAIETARSLGTVVVVSAGNSNSDSGFFSPASCEDAITVAASDRYGARAPYSNIGEVVDISAPGGNVVDRNQDGVLSTLNAGLRGPEADSYANYQGTSMAAPHVAGIAALMLSVDDTLTPDEVECTIEATARPFNSFCPNCGAGIANAEAAVLAVAGGDVSDDCGVTIVEEPFTVPGPVAVGGVRGDQVRFRIDGVAANKQVTVSTAGGAGDADLYASVGEAPSLGGADCVGFNIGNAESCTLILADGGDVHFMVHGFIGFDAVKVRARIRPAPRFPKLRDGRVLHDLAGLEGEVTVWSFTVPEDSTGLQFNSYGGIGDVDMIVRFGAPPDLADVFSNDCVSASFTNTEECTFEDPPAGTWYIALAAYEDYENVNLRANHDP